MESLSDKKSFLKILLTINSNLNTIIKTRLVSKMPEGYIWPRLCLHCGELDPNKLESYEYTFTKTNSYSSGGYQYTQTMTIPVNVHLCENGKRSGRIRFLLKLAIFSIPFIVFLILLAPNFPQYPVILEENSDALFIVGFQVVLLLITLAIPIWYGITRRHPHLHLYSIKYDFGRRMTKFEFSGMIFRKIFKDLNPAAYVKINCRDYLPPDHNSKMESCFRLDPELSLEDFQKLKKIVTSKRPEDVEMKTKLAQQVDLPEKILHTLIARDKYGEIRKIIAKRSSLPYNIIELLSRKPIPIRLLIAERNDLTTNIINRLLNDQDSGQVRATVYMNYLRSINPFQLVETTRAGISSLDSRERDLFSAYSQSSESGSFTAPSGGSNEIKCPNCGNAAPRGQFCPHCGRFIE